jgi:hypothetical protein
MPSKRPHHSPKTWASSLPVACKPWCWSNNCAPHCKRFSALIGRLPSSRRGSPTTAYFEIYRVPARIWRHGCSSPSGRTADASRTPMSCRNTPALRRSPNAAARRVGSIGVGSVQRLCARHLSNGPVTPSTNRSGPVPTIVNNAATVALIKPQYAHWRSSGFASSIAVGKLTRHTMSLGISTPSESAAPHYLRTSTWMRKTLDGLTSGREAACRQPGSRPSPTSLIGQELSSDFLPHSGHCYTINQLLRSFNMK